MRGRLAKPVACGICQLPNVPHGERMEARGLQKASNFYRIFGGF